VRTFCGQGEFFRCARPQILAQKTLDFSKFMVCPHVQEVDEVEPMRIFCRQDGEGVNFPRFCADVLDGPLLCFDYFTKVEIAKFFTAISLSKQIQFDLNNW